ncbi:CatB-related O-acetyltransferase [Azotobacter sp. CWF10]
MEEFEIAAMIYANQQKENVRYKCMSTHLLPEPVTQIITNEFLSSFRETGISTAWDIKDFDQNKGWLADIRAYTFKRAITIEGPSAFYGGPYGPNAWTVEGGLCSMGAASYSHSPLPEGMVVGRYCSIGKGLRFLDFSHPTDWVSSSVAFFKPTGVNSTSALANLADRLISLENSSMTRMEFNPRQGKEYPHIGHDVWIGENVTLAMGITIGTGSIIAAGSIVTRNVPPYAIVAGVPAAIRKYRFDQELTQELLSVEWWKYCFSDFSGLDIKKPGNFVNNLKSLIKKEEISSWKPRTLQLPLK